jgi:cytochrome c oxidase subunit 2
MLRKIHVLSEEDYQAKYTTLKPKSNETPVEKGERLYKNNCSSCHSNQEGERRIGPSFWGIYGRKGETSTGEAYVANEDYIRESIMYPMAKVVKGYNPVMNSFKGLLDEDEVSSIIAYMKTLK